MIKPATSAAIPPAICCSEELMLIKAPRSAISGMALVKADDGTILLITPVIMNTFKIITIQKGVSPRLVYTTHMIIIHTEAIANILNLLTRSLRRPIKGITNTEHSPEIMVRLDQFIIANFEVIKCKSISERHHHKSTDRKQCCRSEPYAMFLLIKVCQRCMIAVLSR